MPNQFLVLDWHRRWNSRLLQFLRRRVRSGVDIEDLAQETYLRLLRASDLTEVRNPQAYLVRVASNVLSEWREWREGSGPTQSMSDEDCDLLIDEHVPDLDLHASLSLDRLSRILTAMSPMMQAVLILRLRDQTSYKAIAQSLDITRRQVHRYLARGYKKLREALEE